MKRYLGLEVESKSVGGCRWRWPPGLNWHW